MVRTGIFLSNGPGDPSALEYAVQATRDLVKSGVPIFGICLGHQILGQAFGGKTFKLKFGHRGGNQPVKDLETGRKLGALIAQNLASDIQAMGLSAVQAVPGSVPQVGDGVIRGYLISVEGGSTVKRFVIGFGSGASEMDTIVEGYAVTAQGWRKLGSGTLSSSGNKMPGMVAPAAVAIATGNPIGVIVMGGAKIYGEASGKNTLEGRAKSTADAIAEQLKIRFRERGWIS